MSLYGRYISTFFHERKTNTCALSENESKTLQALCTDANIVIMNKPGKSNGVDVLNHAEYIANMYTAVCDTSEIYLCSADNVADHIKFQNCLEHLKSVKAVDKDTYWQIHLTAACTLAPYGLSKYTRISPIFRHD